MHNPAFNNYHKTIDTLVSFAYITGSRFQGADQMSEIYKWVRAARRRGWHVDCSAYTGDKGAGKIVFSGKIEDRDFMVFYDPRKKDFFGVMNDGVTFASYDIEEFNGISWYMDIYMFFYPAYRRTVTC